MKHKYERAIDQDGLKQAISVAGSIGKLGRILGISQQAISKWRWVPARHIIAVERATGVPREVLRPDLYRDTPVQLSAEFTKQSIEKIEKFARRTPRDATN
jgi:DNA-binding transcriptional regulator YdaS (Cro superfamily)